MPISVYNAEKHEQIVRLIEAGNYFETAANAAGVTAKTAREWLRKGVNGDPLYAQFAVDVMRAQALAEAHDVHAIGRAAQGSDWRAAAWRLERRNPRKWGTKIHVTVQEELHAFFDALESEFAGNEEVLARIYGVAHRLGGDAPALPAGDEYVDDWDD